MPDHRAPAPRYRLTPEVRRRLYLVLTAAVPLLIAYGVVSETVAPLWVGLIGAALGTGTAAANTPRKDRPDGASTR